MGTQKLWVFEVAMQAKADHLLAFQSKWPIIIPSTTDYRIIRPILTINGCD